MSIKQNKLIKLSLIAFLVLGMMICNGYSVKAEPITNNEIDTEEELEALFTNGGTGKLTADLELDGQNQITINTTVSLDLNGKTIHKKNELQNYVFCIGSGGNVSLNNGIISVNNETVRANGTLFFSIAYGASLSVDGVNLSASGKFFGTSKMSLIENNGNLTLKNLLISTIKNAYVLNNTSTGDAIINNVLLVNEYNNSISQYTSGFYNKGKLEINNGSTAFCKYLKTEAIKNVDGTTTIKSGIINGVINITGGKVVLDGGTLENGMLPDDRPGHTGQSVDNPNNTGIEVNGGAFEIKKGSINTIVNVNEQSKLTIDKDYNNEFKVKINNNNVLPFALTTGADVDQVDLIDLQNTESVMLKNDTGNIIKLIKDISVYYNPNGATSGTIPIAYYNVDHINLQNTSGEKFNLETNTGNLAKTGNRFVGWNTKDDGTGTHYDAGAELTNGITEKLTLYAEWAKEYTVTYHKNIGGSDKYEDTTKYIKGETATVKANTDSNVNFSRGDQYDFIGWTTISDGTGDSYSANDTIDIVDKNIDLYAKWQEKYQIIYNSNNATSGTCPSDDDGKYFSKDSQVSILGNTGTLTKTGYSFVGWNTKNDGTGTQYLVDSKLTISENTTLYAQWAHTCDEVTYDKVIKAAGELNSGNYYLSSDLALTDTIKIVDNAVVNICLNGYLINGSALTNQNVFTIGQNATVTVDSCVKTREHNFDVTNNLAVLNDASGATTIAGATIYGGSKTIGQEDYTQQKYGAAFAVSNSSSLTINNVNIVGFEKDYYGVIVGINGNSNIVINSGVSILYNNINMSNANSSLIHGITVVLDGCKIKNNRFDVNDNSEYSIILNAQNTTVNNIEISSNTIVGNKSLPLLTLKKPGDCEVKNIIIKENTITQSIALSSTNGILISTVLNTNSINTNLILDNAYIYKNTINTVKNTGGLIYALGYLEVKNGSKINENTLTITSSTAGVNHGLIGANKTIKIDNAEIKSNILSYSGDSGFEGAIVYANNDGLENVVGINISNSVINSNKITSNGLNTVNGSLLYSYSKGKIVLVNTTIEANEINKNNNDNTKNTALIGGIGNGSEVSIDNCVIKSNYINSLGSITGGLFYSYGDLNVKESTIDSNTVIVLDGTILGGLLNSRIDLVYDASSLSNNHLTGKYTVISDVDILKGGLIYTPKDLTIKDTSATKTNKVAYNTINLYPEVSGTANYTVKMEGYLFNSDKTLISDISIDHNIIDLKDMSNYHKLCVDGGIYSRDNLSADYLTFGNNELKATGKNYNQIKGGILYGDKDITLSNLTLSKNEIRNGEIIDGGIIWNKNESSHKVIINGTNNVINENIVITSSEKDNKGLLFDIYDLKLENTTINKNSALCVSDNVEGVIINSKNLKLVNSTINNNIVKAKKLVGSVATYVDKLELHNSSIYSNTITVDDAASHGLITHLSDAHDEYPFDKNIIIDGTVKINNNILNSKESPVELFYEEGNYDYFEVLDSKSLDATSRIPFDYLTEDQNTYNSLYSKEILIADVSADKTISDKYLDCFNPTNTNLFKATRNNKVFLVSRIKANPSKDNDYTFKLDTTGLNNVTYQWYRIKNTIDDNYKVTTTKEVLTGNTNAKFNKAQVVSGDYYCVVTADDNLVYTSGIINFEPETIEQPTTVNSYEFKVSEQGLTNINYSWYKLENIDASKKILDDTKATGLNSTTYNSETQKWSSPQSTDFSFTLEMNKGDCIIVDPNLQIFVNGSYYVNGFMARLSGTYTFTLYDIDDPYAAIETKIYTSKSDDFGYLNVDDIEPLNYKNILGIEVFTKLYAENYTYINEDYLINMYYGIDGYYQGLKLNLYVNDVYNFKLLGNHDSFKAYLIKESDINSYDSISELKDLESLEYITVNESGSYYFIYKAFDNNDKQVIYPTVVSKIGGCGFKKVQDNLNKLDGEEFYGDNRYLCLMEYSDGVENSSLVSNSVYKKSAYRAKLYELGVSTPIVDVPMKEGSSYNLGFIKAGTYELVLNNHYSSYAGLLTVNTDGTIDVEYDNNLHGIIKVSYQVDNGTSFILVDGLVEAAAKIYRSGNYAALIDESGVDLRMELGQISDDGSIVFKSLRKLISDNKFGSTKFAYYDFMSYLVYRGQYNEINDTEELITILIPFNTKNKESFAIARCHSDEGSITYDLIPKGKNNANEYGEYYEIKEDYIELHVRKFSIYAIGYAPVVEPEEEYDPTPVIKIVKTGVEGPSSNSSIIKVISLLSLVGIVLVNKKKH